MAKLAALETIPQSLFWIDTFSLYMNFTVFSFLPGLPARPAETDRASCSTVTVTTSTRRGEILECEFRRGDKIAASIFIQSPDPCDPGDVGVRGVLSAELVPYEIEVSELVLRRLELP